MKTRTRRLAVAAVCSLAVCLLGAGAAQAIPSLQLDILPGDYNTSTGPGGIPTEMTTVATGDQFMLYAFMLPDGRNALDLNYYISAALIPSPGYQGILPGGAFGTFDFGGVTIDTGSMLYGYPPIEFLSTGTTAAGDPGDLASHSVFPTYFTEFRFQFTGATVPAYNVQDGATEPGTMFVAPFAVDVSNLLDGYAIHFDLYNENFINTEQVVVRYQRECTGTGSSRTCIDVPVYGTNEWTTTGQTALTTDVDIRDVAPFSHDAESGHRRTVPEPGTLLLLGAGFFGLGLAWRRRNA